MCKEHQELLKLQSEYSELFNNDYFIFPENWFEIEDQDELKIKILKEAIKNKKLIIDVEGGNTFIQKVWIYWRKILWIVKSALKKKKI